MKRLTIAIFGLCLTIAASAQIVQENELALVYYMPENQLVFDIEYTEETLEAGPFFLFVEKYLGTEDVIQENRTIYHLTGVQAHLVTHPDYTRAYKVVPEKGMQTQLLSLSKDGLLYGYNVCPPEKKPRKQEGKEEKIRVARPDVMPLLEEQIAAPTLQQKAEGAAKQIYRIRETRMYILGGEIDHAPADGRAMELVLRELDRQERQLTELFTGKRSIKRMHKTVTYIPSKSEEYALLYFSEDNGITTDEDASGSPLLLTIVAHKQVKSAAAEQGKKAPQPSQLYYNLPGSADYAVTYGDVVLVERTMPVAQFGIAVPLAHDLFTGTALPEIYLNIQTGNIQSIRLQK